MDTEARLCILLQADSGRWFCAECLAVLMSVDLHTIHEAMTILERAPGYQVNDDRCFVCECLKRVVRAVVDSPRRP
jgi:hypothetical protein